MMRRLAAFALVALLLLSSVAALSLRAVIEAPLPLPPEGVLVRIPAGASMRQIAARLEDAGVVRSRWLLLALARWQGGERGLRAGTYLFEGAPTPKDVFLRLRSASASERRVTIPEGRSAGEVFELLERAGFGGADLFACTAASPDWLLRHDLPATGVEGYLFPDTYSFGPDVEPEAVLDAMIARFRQKTSPLEAERARAGLDPNQWVTLASLIEKETGEAGERSMIAAVFLNRLRLGMPLQADPTVTYEREGPRQRPINRADLLANSDYNTYQRRGLPPGPIANPGLAALEAALRPAAADYLYFVSRNDGTHEFSRTLEEHNRAVQRYQRAPRNT